MHENDLIERLEHLQDPDDETDILVWLLFGTRLGVPQADRYNRLLTANRDHLHFIPSATWNGRNLAAALEWCRTNNRDEIHRVARDWGVPRFTSSLDAARMLIGDERHLSMMCEADGPHQAVAVVRPRTGVPHDSMSEPSIQAIAGLLPCAICIAAIHSIT